MIALITVPLSVMVTAKIGKRSQSRFVAQWTHVGVLNGQIEEAFTGHALVNVFGRRPAIEARFRAKNDELYEASFRAELISSIIMPPIMFVGNPRLRATTDTAERCFAGEFEQIGSERDAVLGLRFRALVSLRGDVQLC